MTKMKIVFVLMVTTLNLINSLPTLDYSNDTPLTGLSQELISILRNSRLNSLSSLSPNFPKGNPSSDTSPASSFTLNPSTNYNNPTSNLPTSHDPPLNNPTEPNSDYLSSPSTTPVSDSAPIPQTDSNKAFNLDTLLNYSRNNHNSLLSSLLQKSVPNSYPDTTQLLQSLLRPSTSADTLPPKIMPTVASPSDPSTGPQPNFSQYQKPHPKLLSIEPMTLSPKANEEILKLLSSSPASPLQEPIKNSEPNSVLTPDSNLLPDTPLLIPPSLPDSPYKDSTVSQPSPSPPPPSPTPPSPSSDTLSANQLLNVLVSSPSVVKELTSLLESFSAQNSNSSPIQTAANQQPPGTS